MTNAKQVYVLLLLVACFLAMGAIQAAEPPAPAPATAETKTKTSAPAAAPAYTLTELQHAHLHEAQLQFFLASRDLQKAGEEFNRACASIRAENKWPEGVQCSVQDLSIVPPAKK